MERDQLRQLIRQIITEEMRTLLDTSPDVQPEDVQHQVAADPREVRLEQRVLTGPDLEDIAPHTTVRISAEAIVSPLAMDILEQKNIRLIRGLVDEPVRIALAADHGGFRLKQAVKGFLEEWGYPCLDLGSHSAESVHYPEFAHKVARAVSGNQADLGIVIDTFGMGSAIVANKVPGVRAVCCFNEEMAISSREHNHANVLALGGKSIDETAARGIVRKWLDSHPLGDRHALRVGMIAEIEKKYIKD